jgi:hypothetical protein
MEHLNKIPIAHKAEGKSAQNISNLQKDTIEAVNNTINTTEITDDLLKVF